jgi:transcriptional regulator with XRE-family HTH domain
MAREGSGCSIEELAETLGVSRQTITCYELGTKLPRADRLPALARKLGRPIDWFFSDQPDPIGGSSLAAEKANPDTQLSTQLAEMARGIEQIRVLLERMTSTGSWER